MTQCQNEPHLPARSDDPASRAARLRITPWIVWLTWLAMSIAAVVFVREFGVELPAGDDWRNVPQAVGAEPVTLQWLWMPANEHRIPLARALYAGVCRLAGGDIRAGMYANALLLSGTTALMLLASRAVRGRYALTDLLLPLLLLHLGMYSQYTRCIQIHFVSATVLVALFIWGVFGASKPSALRLSLMSVLTMLLPLDGGTTLVFAVPMLCWCAFQWWDAVRRSGASFAMAGVAGGIPLALTLAETVLYLVHLPKKDVVYGTLLQAAAAVPEVAYLAWGNSQWGYRYYLGCATLLLLAASPVIAWRLCRRNTIGLVQCVGICALAAGQMAVIGAIAYGRAHLTIAAANPDRYLPLIAPAVIIPFLAIGLVKSRSGSIIRLLLATLAIALWMPNNWRGVRISERERAARVRVIDQLRAGMPLEAVATNVYEYIHPRARLIPKFLKLLADAKVGPYRDPAIVNKAPHAFTETTIALKEVAAAGTVLSPQGEWRSDESEVLSLDLKQRDIVGIRLYYDGVSPDEPHPGNVIAVWEPSEKRSALRAKRKARFSLLGPEDKPEPLVILPFEQLRSMRLTFDRPGGGISVSRIGLLHQSK